MVEKSKYLDRKNFIQRVWEIIDLKYKTKNMLLIFFFLVIFKLIDHQKILLNLGGPESHLFIQEVISALWHLSFPLGILFPIHVDS